MAQGESEWWLGGDAMSFIWTQTWDDWGGGGGGACVREQEAVIALVHMVLNKMKTHVIFYTKRSDAALYA